MKIITSSLVTLLVAFGTANAFDGNKTKSEPAYNPKTEVEVSGPVSAIHEVSEGALQGIHFSVKMKTQTIELFLGPSNFLKFFNVDLKNGDTVTVIGSKVLFEEKDIVLVRELQMGKITVTFRDAKGEPQWLWMSKPDLPTGF